MLPRERIEAAIEFRAPDKLPLRIFAAAGGLYEHGQKLVDLIKACGHDFGDLSGLTLPEPPGPEDFDPDGRYHAIRTDEWGTTWEYRIYGIWGHPIGWPLNDLSRLDTYVPPPTPVADGPDVEAGRAAWAAAREQYFLLGGGGSIFERLHSLRRFEEVLMDIALDTPEINRIVDMIVDNNTGHVARSLALGADGIAFGDDYGTQEAPLLAPDTWRRFFRPRYERLFAPIRAAWPHQTVCTDAPSPLDGSPAFPGCSAHGTRAAGRRIFFHTCGQVGPWLGDFRELGMDVIWPQLTAFDVPELVRICRDLHLAVELHPDRGDLMQRSTPEDVRSYVYRLLETFDTASGGSWLYLEVDPGFPWENIEALFGVAMELRG